MGVSYNFDLRHDLVPFPLYPQRFTDPDSFVGGPYIEPASPTWSARSARSLALSRLVSVSRYGGLSASPSIGLGIIPELPGSRNNVLETTL